MVRALAGVTASSLFCGFLAWAALSSPRLADPTPTAIKWFGVVFFFAVSFLWGTMWATCPLFRPKS